MSLQVNVGKGGNWLFPHLCDVLGLDPSVCCVVGDRLDTDIALGKQGGMLTVLPLTGGCCVQGHPSTDTRYIRLCVIPCDFVTDGVWAEQRACPCFDGELDRHWQSARQAGHL